MGCGAQGGIIGQHHSHRPDVLAAGMIQTGQGRLGICGQAGLSERP